MKLSEWAFVAARLCQCTWSTEEVGWIQDVLGGRAVAGGQAWQPGCALPQLWRGARSSTCRARVLMGHGGGAPHAPVVGGACSPTPSCGMVN